MKIGKIIMLSMIGVAAMVGCSEDDLGNDNKEYGILQPVVGAFPGDKIALSRADEGQPKWQMYESLYPLSLENEPTIGVFMTHNNTKMGEISGTFTYKMDDLTNTPKWISNIPVEDGTPYNIFGYMSANNKSWNASIEPNGTYASGAIMKLNKLNVVTASDVSVVVGVLKGKIEDSTDSTTMANTIASEGQDYYGDKTKESYLGSYNFTGEKDKNFIYLWMDHLYACINFELNMDDDYGELRVIKLKQVKLVANDAYKTYDVKVELGTNSADPISKVDYTPTAGAEKDTTSAVLFSSKNGEKIPKVSSKSFLNIPGYFAPAASFEGDGQYIDVTFTYDLYTVNSDGKEILEKTSRTATNRIKIGELLRDMPEDKKLGRGKMLTIRATVQPSYLYVLADEDLNNPTFKIEIED